MLPIIKIFKEGNKVDTPVRLSLISLPTSQEILKNNHNQKLAATKGLLQDGKVSTLFSDIHNMYKLILEKQLNDKLPFKEFERQLADSDLHYVALTKEQQNFYQRYSSLKTKYIYLRNDVYVERLSKRDLTTFENNRSNEKFLVDPALNQIVKETSEKVTRVIDDDNPELMTGYDLSGKKNVLNNSVVFEISYQVDYDPEGNYINKSREIVKEEYLTDDLVPELLNSLTTELSQPVAIFIETL